MLGVVFAAGLGTRLRPLTESVPKPAVPLFNRPLASYSLERLAALGIRHVAINTHHLGDVVARELGRHAPAELDVRFVHEPALLGTGGGLRNALEVLVRDVGASEPIVVMNGDIVYWPDLEGAIALHARLDAIATVVLRSDLRTHQLGALGVDGEGRVRRLLGKPDRVSAPLVEHMFTGVHVLSARAVADLPEQGCIIRTSYRRWLDDGAVVGGFVDESPWRDLGTPTEYLRTSLELLRRDLRWPGSALGPAIQASASIGEGARLDEVIAGEGAQIDPGITLRRVVVWPGTHVREDACDAIIAPHATVRVGR